jgi:hypothetical protein
LSFASLRSRQILGTKSAFPPNNPTPNTISLLIRYIPLSGAEGVFVAVQKSNGITLNTLTDGLFLSGCNKSARKQDESFVSIKSPDLN